MRFEDLNWMDVENYLQHDDRIILVLGACEQHGYLSLLTDIKIPLALADAVSRETNVVIAPPLNFGCSPYFLSFPGTISLRAETMIHVVNDIIVSLFHHGFRRIFILNGHGGNQSVKAHLYDLVNQYEGLVVQWYEWWHSPQVEAIARKYDLKPAHANWLEAYPFTVVSELPEAVKPELESSPIVDAERYRQFIGDGSFGGRYSAGQDVMDEIFQACLQEVLEIVGT